MKHSERTLFYLFFSFTIFIKFENTITIQLLKQMGSRNVTNPKCHCCSRMDNKVKTLKFQDFLEIETDITQAQKISKSVNASINGP